MDQLDRKTYKVTCNASGTHDLRPKINLFEIENKAEYTANSVAFGWAGAVFEVTRSFGEEQ